jgi:hypothetical protein
MQWNSRGASIKVKCSRFVKNVNLKKNKIFKVLTGDLIESVSG